MRNDNANFLIIASYADSLVDFRGELIKDLVRRGCDVHVAVPGVSDKEALFSRLNQWGVKVHSFPLSRTGLNPAKDIVSFFYLLYLIFKIRPSTVLAYTIKPVVYGVLAAAVAGVRYRYALITGLGYAFTDESGAGRKKIRNLIKGLYAVALSRVTKVFFQNPDDQNLFENLGILKPSTKSCVVNGSGIDVSEYQFSPAKGGMIFLLIARLLGDKGVREYARAAAAVKVLYPEAKFLLVGWIDENPDAIDRKELEAWIDSGAIEYLGRLDDVRPVIAESSVYVLPSYREGTPRTVLEAMSIGRAIITTDAPGCRETVVDGKNGYLVPVKDSEALADAMIKFIKNPSDIEEMGVASRYLAENKYDVREVNRVMLSEMGIS
ncbi:glycosyltransferase family 4 protein [Alloalcanivorax sp. C16-2]|uniref:glycosyltransferase family 4 protein n=1 Tax=Alloalcanivorax sp. C16-2 TaxID=3390052 RepID=UPI00397094FB